MGKTFEGCVEAREISLTRKAANPHAVVLVRKTAETQPENTDMATEAEIQKAALATAVAFAQKSAAWSEVTRSYFSALPADKAEAFMAKSADEQKTEAETAKAAADKAEIDKQAAASGKTARELELEKSVGAQGAKIADLEKRLAEQDIEKRARDEFAGFPGGVPAAVEVLKTAQTLRNAGDDAGAVRVEAMMKSQIELARTGVGRHGARPEVDTTKSAGARTRIDAEATKRAEARKIPFSDAQVEVYLDAAFAEDVKLVEAGE